MRGQGVDPERMNIVIVTHGLAIRLFLMRWFQLTIDEFENSINPANASLSVMVRQSNEHGEQWFEMDELTKETLNLHSNATRFKVK